MTSEQLDQVLAQIPDSVSWSNTVRQGGRYVGVIHGAFVASSQIQEVKSIIGRDPLVDHVWGDSYLVK